VRSGERLMMFSAESAMGKSARQDHDYLSADAKGASPNPSIREKLLIKI
jgi:hypothetical protein